MYVQVTTRCNMRCAHCCFSCGADGVDMRLETFRAALDLLPGATVTLGGGEPTLHPLFWTLVNVALERPEVPCVEVITNGSQTATALRLAELAGEGLLGCTLSRDAFHDPIDSRVVEAFLAASERRRFGDFSGDGREVRDVTDRVLRLGRASSDPAAVDGCPCPDPFVTPDGRVLFCGCPDAPVLATLCPRPSPLPETPILPPDIVPRLWLGRCHRDVFPKAIHS